MEPTPGRVRTTLLTSGGVLVAVALVALASRGSTSAGGGGARRPADALLDILFSLYLVALVAGAALFVYLIALARYSAGGDEGGGRKRNWLGLAVLAGAMFLLADRLPQRRAGGETVVPELGGGAATLPPEEAGRVVADSGFAWVPVLVTLGLLALAVGGWLWSGRARRRVRGERLFPVLAEELAAALDLSLDDLRAEPDPRRAVIGAYARLERVLAAHGLPRRPAEAPLEYLGRMLAELEVGDDAARRLTALFERAKFSQHAVGPEMKADAIDALEHVRDDLLAAQALRDEARRAVAAGAA